MKQPCDEAVIGAGVLGTPCEERSRPWVFAATILGSSMAFIDSTVVNVALPTLQSNLHASNQTRAVTVERPRSMLPAPA